MRDLYRGDGGPLSSYDEGWNDGIEAALAAIEQRNSDLLAEFERAEAKKLKEIVARAVLAAAQEGK